MNIHLSGLAAAGIAGLLGCATALGDDWPQWRGPNRDGISRETGLLKEWAKDGPKLLWQVKNVGGGYSTPAVVGDKVFVLGNEGLENEFVKALSTADGREVWTSRIGNVGEPKQQPAYPGTRSTPTVDGEWVYALGSDGDLACLAKATGKPRWQKNLRTEFGGKPGRWAYSESPLVDGDAVVCTPGGENATLVALNKRTGDVIWKAVIPDNQAASYASIMISHAGGLKQYVQFIEKGIVGVDAKTGKFLWRWDRPAQGSPANIPTPVIFEDYVYAGSGRAGGGLAKLNVKDGAVEVQTVYFEQKMPTAIGGAIKVGSELYGTASKAMLCLDFLTGQLKWENGGIGAASLCFAQGMFYLHGENGEVALVEASPEGYREKGRFTPPEMPDRGRSASWAYPVVSNGRLYIRDLGSLWSYDVRDRELALRTSP
jgi:outer membrane protein assembly factor BamB